jgi:hypothetical protein
MIEIKKLNKEQWNELSEKAHSICFNEHKPSEWDRIDFALVGDNFGIPMGYITCRETDAKTLYWQFGGAFPSSKETVWCFHTYQKFVDFCRSDYERITTLIENTNTVMLKMAMKVGFRIVGIRYFKGSVLLEHLLEFNDA